MKFLDEIVEKIIDKIQESCIIDRDYYGNIYSFDCVHNIIRKEVFEFIKENKCPSCGSRNVNEFRNDEGGYSLCLDCGVRWSYPRLVSYMKHKIWNRTTDERLKLYLDL